MKVYILIDQGYISSCYIYLIDGNITYLQVHHLIYTVELFDVLGRGGQDSGMLHYGSTRDINRSIHQKTAISAFDAIYCLKECSAGYFWSCIFVFFIAHWNMWNNINHWHKNTQLELFLTLLSCNYNTTISIKTNRSITWTLPMMLPALTSWKIDYAETTKLGGWLVFSLGLLMFRLVDS